MKSRIDVLQTFKLFPLKLVQSQVSLPPEFLFSNAFLGCLEHLIPLKGNKEQKRGNWNLQRIYPPSKDAPGSAGHVAQTI